MLEVPTHIGPSIRHGIGVFAVKLIPKGTIVWRFRPKLDILISEPLIEHLPEHTQRFIRHHRYINPRAPMLSVMCFDDARFMNFDDNANTCAGEVHEFEEDLVASRDINPGEEITVLPSSDHDYSRKLGKQG